MADYSNLSAAISAGITNMSIIRNNIKNDDGTDTIAGVSWFYFNSVVASNLYISGNSWFGFGTNGEQLKVNRRDAAAYYIYREEGLIGTVKFLKIRWIGYSYYGSTADADMQQYDVFLFDNGEIYFNFYDVPVTNCDGTNALVCGSTTITYTAAANTPCEYTFTPSAPATGTGWSVASGKPEFTKVYKTSGTAVYAVTAFQSITNCRTATISWNADTPDGTTVDVYAALGATTPLDSDYVLCGNSSEITSLTGADMSGKNLYVKVTLSTTNVKVTPTFNKLVVKAEDVMVQDFVSAEMFGVYKVYCDIRDKIHGITVINKKTSRLRFASTGERMPVFSTHMFIEGQIAYIDGAYVYEPVNLQLSNFDASEASEVVATSLWTAIDAGSIYESVLLEQSVFTSAETITINLI